MTKISESEMIMKLKLLERTLVRLEEVVSAHTATVSQLDKTIALHQIFIENATKSINGNNIATNKLDKRIDKLVMWLVGALLTLCVTLLVTLFQLIGGNTP